MKRIHDAFNSSPPRVGVLFAPQRVGALHAQRCANCGDDLVLIGQQQRLEFGCAEVETEKHIRQLHESG